MHLFRDHSCLLGFCRVCPEKFPAKGLKILPIPKSKTNLSLEKTVVPEEITIKQIFHLFQESSLSQVLKSIHAKRLVVCLPKEIK